MPRYNRDPIVQRRWERLKRLRQLNAPKLVIKNEQVLVMAALYHVTPSHWMMADIKAKYWMREDRYGRV